MFSKKFKSFINKLFTPVNFSKVIVIFSVGIISRLLINDYFDTNVFTEYLTYISITFYSVFSVFIVLINELFAFFNINLIPSVLIDFFNLFFVKPFIYIYSHTAGKNLKALHISERIRPNSYDSFSSNQQFYSLKFHDNSDSSRINRDYPYNGESSNRTQSYQSPRTQLTQSQLYDYIENSCRPNQINSNIHNSVQNSSNLEDSFYTANQDSPESKQHYSNNQFANYNSRYFVVDSLNHNGVTRNLYTPNLTIPTTPRLSNLTTPSTMTPILDSEEYNRVTNTNLSRFRNPSDISIGNYSNSTNHGVVGTNNEPNYINYPARRYNVSQNVQRELSNMDNGTVSLNTEEISIPSNNGKLSLGIRYRENKTNIHSLYIKYHDIIKRKFFWNIWEKGRHNYESYEDFKANFDPNTKIFREIAKITKSDLSREVKDLLKTDPFGTRPRIDVRDIRQITTTSTQERLNNLSASRYGRTQYIPESRLKQDNYSHRHTSHRHDRSSNYRLHSHRSYRN